MKISVQACSIDVLHFWRDLGEFGLDGAEALVGPVVLRVPVRPLVEFRAEFVDAALAAHNFGFGVGDVVGEVVDVVEGGGLLLASLAAELGERPEFLEPLLGAVEAVLGCVEVLLGRFEVQFGLVERRLAVGGPLAEEGLEFGSFRAEPVDACGGVVDSEGGVGLAAEGVEDFSLRGALVGEDAAVVEVGDPGDVPCVGGVAAPALGGVAGVPDEGGCAEEVDLGPGAALDTVDDSGPRWSRVRSQVVILRPGGQARKRGARTMAEVIAASGARPVDDVSVLRPSTTPLSDDEQAAFRDFLSEE